MMFVASISIIVEVGLICAILFDHFKCSVLYSALLAGAMVHGLSGGGQMYIFSLVFQTVILVAFIFFAFGIKLKKYAADRIIIKRDTDLELHHCSLITTTATTVNTSGDDGSGGGGGGGGGGDAQGDHHHHRHHHGKM